MQQATDVSEKRTRPRKASSLPLRIIDRQTRRVLGTLVNITVDGILMDSTTLTAVNCAFELSMELPEMTDGKENVEFTAISVWTDTGISRDDRSRFWTGFSIAEISDADRATLQDLIDNYL